MKANGEKLPAEEFLREENAIEVSLSRRFVGLWQKLDRE